MIDADLRRGTRAARAMTCADIACAINTTVMGDAALVIDGVTTPDVPLAGRAIFLDRCEESLVSLLARAPAQMLVIAPQAYAGRIGQTLIVADNPRVTYSAVVHYLFAERFAVQTVAVDPSARIDPTAEIGVHVVVGSDAEIGPRTRIHSNTVIGPHVRIGADCEIKSGSIIGQPGFGVHRDSNNRPQALPHVGGVVIGDRVLIGALNTVVGGTIHPTVVEDDVKTDDHVHIAHNCHIGARTLLTACAELSGSVRIGPDGWLGPNVSIRDGLKLGARCFVGIGSVVTRNVEDDALVFGSPARPHERTSA